MDGLSQETCRDFMHAQWGMGGLLDDAEIAWKQGLDLYSVGGTLTGLQYLPMWELGYNHFHDWMKQSMPNTQALIAKNRPEGYDHHLGFGTLTHAGMGSSGKRGRRELPSGRNGIPPPAAASGTARGFSICKGVRFRLTPSR